MRILYLTTESLLLDPIIESQVVRLLKELSGDERFFELVVFDDLKNNAVLDKIKNNRNFKITFLQRRFNFLNIFLLVWYVFSNRNKFDIIHCRSYPPMFAGIFGKIFLQKKLIFDPRGVFSHELSYFESRHLLSWFFKFFEKYFCLLSDKIVVVSEKFKDYFLSEYILPEDKIIVVPTFSVLPDFSHNENINLKEELFGNREILLFAYSGSPEKWQMIKEVLTFFKLASNKILNSRFVIFSKSKDEFKKLILENDFNPEHFKVISLSPHQLNFCLNQCDYGVIFRENHIINRVAAPIKIRDYLLSGLPVIITDNIGDSSELVESLHLGYVLKNLDINSFNSVLDKIISNEIIFNKNHISTSVLSIYSLEVICKKYLCLYDSL